MNLGTHAYKESSAPYTSVIVAVYKNVPFLELVLLSLERQSYRNFEVIIAEDDEDSNMKNFIITARNNFSFPILHVHQPDEGFLKNKILNKAVLAASGKYLQFIDGDSVLHHNYLMEFVQQAKEGYCLFGRRVYLDRQLTDKLLKSGNLQKLNLCNILLSQSEQKKHAFYMPWVLKFQRAKVGFWGCSMGIMKSDLLMVNGFDEDYVRIGVGEDIDLEWRLLKAGIKLKSMKYAARQYHLFHGRSGREEDTKLNFQLLEKKKAAGQYFCKNGLSKLMRESA